MKNSPLRNASLWFGSSKCLSNGRSDYDSDDEEEEALSDLRLITPESCNSGAKHVLLDWLEAHVKYRFWRVAEISATVEMVLVMIMIVILVTMACI